MNIPKAIEMAVAELIRTKAQLGAGVGVRPWQSIASDPVWKKQEDRRPVVIDVRASAPSYNDDRTGVCTINVLCITQADDDKDHFVVSGLYEKINDLFDRLFSEFAGATAEDPILPAFKARLAELTGDVFNAQGIGLSWGDAQFPYLDPDLQNVMPLSMRIHFSRSDI